MRVMSQSLYPHIRNVLESRPKAYVSGCVARLKKGGLHGEKEKFTRCQNEYFPRLRSGSRSSVNVLKRKPQQHRQGSRMGNDQQHPVPGHHSGRR